jgi:hypothetical protein
VEALPTASLAVPLAWYILAERELAEERYPDFRADSRPGSRPSPSFKE